MKPLRLADMSILGSCAPDARGNALVWTHPHDYVIDRAGADNARTFAAYLLSAAEAVDPKGYRLELPISDTDLAAPVEMDRAAEHLSIERARRRRRGTH